MSQVSSNDPEGTQISVSDPNASIDNQPVIENESINNSIKGLLSFLHTSDIEDEGVEAVNEIKETRVLLPSKKSKKTQEKEKIKLFSDGQRLIRESYTDIVTYKPKQFKTLGEFTAALKLSESKTQVSENKENIITTMPPPKAPTAEDQSQKLDRILRKNVDHTGNITLRSIEDTQRMKQSQLKIFGKLKSAQTARRLAASTQRAEILEVCTNVKVIDPATGAEVVEPRRLRVRRTSEEQMPARGMDPGIARVVLAGMSEEEQARWRLLGPRERLAVHKKMLSKEAEEKRRVARERRQRESQQENEEEEKADNGGLSDDDFEWREENSEEEDDRDEEEEDEEEEIGLSSRRQRPRIEEDEDDQTFSQITQFTDDVSSIEGSRAPLSWSRAILSPEGGPRARRTHELTPPIEEEYTELPDLPAEAVSLLGRLKARFGLTNAMACGWDSSIVLLPSCKTTIACLEARIRRDLAACPPEGLSGILAPLEALLERSMPQTASWTDDFDLLGAVRADRGPRLGNFSFMETLSPPGESVFVGDEDTIILEKGDGDEASAGTEVLCHSPDRECDPAAADTAEAPLPGGTNEIHARLFQFEDEDEQEEMKATKSASRAIFAGLGALVEASDQSEDEDEDDVDLDDESSSEDDMGDPSDEEEAQRRLVQRPGRPLIPAEYLDEEAELSGSDEGGSDDEEIDAHDDHYEEEAGDRDEAIPEEPHLRRQVGRIHQRLEADEDARDLRYLRERFLEDGDEEGLGGARRRRYLWEGLGDEDGDHGDRGDPLDDEDDQEEVTDQQIEAGGPAVAPEEPMRREEALVREYDLVLAASRPGHRGGQTGPRQPIRTGSMLGSGLVIGAPAGTDLKTRMADMYSWGQADREGAPPGKRPRAL